MDGILIFAFHVLNAKWWIGIRFSTLNGKSGNSWVGASHFLTNAEHYRFVSGDLVKEQKSWRVITIVSACFFCSKQKEFRMIIK
jgi:hypothetical protein